MFLPKFTCVIFCGAFFAHAQSFDLTTISTKTTPESLVVGDFNRDGKPDLAVSGFDASGNGTVEILLGNGDGTFRSSNVVEVGGSASYIVKADFNGDGKLDLAVSVGTAGHVMILLGNGDGTFRTSADSGASTPSGNLSSLIPGLAVGDINGDGKSDLVLGPYTFASNCSISVMLGNGDGTFRTPVSSSFDRVDLPKVGVADFNSDGRDDLFISGTWITPGRRYGYLFGNPDGSLAISWSKATYPFTFSSVFAVGDVNGNGKPDVMTVDYIDYPNAGRLPIIGFLDGSLSEGGGGSTDIPTDSDAGLNYVSAALADVNGDGHADLLISDSGGFLTVILGTGDGTFNGPAGYPPPSPSPTIYTGSLAYNDHWGSLTTADFRGVGKPDVVVALAGGSVVLLENSAAPAPSVTAASVRNAASLAAVPSVAGGLMAIFGSALSYGSGGSGTSAPPETAFGLTVQMNGIDAPLLYTSPTQANIQVPWEVAGATQLTLLINRNRATQSITIPLATAAPGLFTMNGEGTGQAAALVAATPPVIAAPAGAFPGSRPIHAGEYLSVYGTGLGAVNPGNAPYTGQAGSADPTLATPLVTVGGVPAIVQYSGIAPGMVGAYQVNIQIPANAPVGNAIPVALTIGGAAANLVTIAIQ